MDWYLDGHTVGTVPRTCFFCYKLDCDWRSGKVGFLGTPDNILHHFYTDRARKEKNRQMVAGNCEVCHKISK